MREPFLEVTYQHGRAIAAYLYLARQPGEKSVSTRRVEPGLVIDFASEGRSLGIEITAPQRTSPAAINRVLEEMGLSPLSQDDLAPLQAA